MKRTLTSLLLLGLLSGAATAANDPLSTLAEQSGFQRTGRYDEVEKLCRNFALKYPGQVRIENFGRTPEGRPMLALIVSQGNGLTPEAAKAARLPVVLMQGGIHAGEIDGKDAGFLALRELLAKPSSLQKCTFVFVPVFNVDGHERFGKFNRPNQVGPLEMGWRVTSQNLNLNRDYGKDDTPEMTAMLGLLNRWDPILYVDLHVTDGAEFQPDVANLVEPIYIGDPAMHPLAEKLQVETNAFLKAKGASPLAFYPSLQDPKNPASGFSNSAYTPRFSTGYWPLSNRFAMLVETHSWKPYATRVKITHDAIVTLLDEAAVDGPQWLQAAHDADQAADKLGGKMQTLAWKTTDKHSMIDFPGYAYKREMSPVSGEIALSYDPKKPQNWHIPFYPEVVPSLEVEAPRGGYLIPPAHAVWVAERLKNHGILFDQLQRAIPEQPLEVFRAEKTEFGKQPSEGHQKVELSGHWSKERHGMPAGGLYVPIAQPKARLVMALLEPRAPDSFASWGFFNAHFEQKEYMEEYVAEAVGREMLATRPEIKSEFERRLKEDPAFAKSPEARLDFFYRHHPSYDAKFNLYPVMRTEKAPGS